MTTALLPVVRRYAITEDQLQTVIDGMPSDPVQTPDDEPGDAPIEDQQP